MFSPPRPTYEMPIFLMSLLIFSRKIMSTFSNYFKRCFCSTVNSFLEQSSAKIATKDFYRVWFSGATQADAAILVVNAARGEFETGFELGGQTREHTMLIRSLGIRMSNESVQSLSRFRFRCRFRLRREPSGGRSEQARLSRLVSRTLR